MKFSEQKAVVVAPEKQCELPYYQSEYLALQHQPDIESIRKKCVYHLTDDLTQLKNDINIKQFLGDEFYNPSNDYARECLEICFVVQNLYGFRIKPWTDSALKCYDNFLIRYINHTMKESIAKHSGRIKETDVYEHLINKKIGADYEIGIAFQSIYQSRNSFTHVQEEEENGRRRPVKWTGKRYNQERDRILMNFQRALKYLLPIIMDS